MILDKKTRIDVFMGILLGLICVVISATVIKFDAGGFIRGSKFGEASATEITQLIYLLLALCLLTYTAVLSKARRGILVLFAGMVAVLMIREMDGLLDHIYHGAWLPLALVVMSASVFLAYPHRRMLFDNLGEFIMMPAFGALVAACLSIFVFSRLFGTKDLWESFFDVQQLSRMQRWVKDAVEEGSELFGYTLLFLSSFGFSRLVKRAECMEESTGPSGPNVRAFDYLGEPEADAA